MLDKEIVMTFVDIKKAIDNNWNIIILHIMICKGLRDAKVHYRDRRIVLQHKSQKALICRDELKS